MSEKWVSISEVARRLGCSRITATLRLKDRTIPGLTVFLRRKRVNRQVFEKWAKKQPI